MTSDAQRFATQQVRSTLATTPEPSLRRIQPGEAFGARLWLLLGACACVLVIGVIAALGGLHGPATLAAVSLGALILLGLSAHWVNRELLKPMRLLRQWAVGMCGGPFPGPCPKSSPRVCL